MKLPRFKLRTLFVLVAILAIPMAWAAYQLNWIRERHEFIAQYRIPLIGPVHYQDVRVNLGGAESQSLTDRPQWSLELFGEKKCPSLTFPASELARFNRLFPEGEVDPRRVFGQDQ